MNERVTTDSNRRALSTTWPQPPAGRTVVLNVRVVTGSGGGPETTILASAVHFDATDYWMAAAYMHRPDDRGFVALQQRAAARNCELIAIPDRGVADLRVLRQLLALCRHLRVGIWHGHDYKSNLIGLLLRPRHRMTLLSTAHGWVTQTRRTPIYYAVDRWCLRHYDHVISVSADLYAQVSGLGIAPARHTLIHNGVDEQRFCRRQGPGPARLRSQCGVSPTRRVIGAVGRLSDEKRFEDLIRAVHALRRGGYDAALWIAGEGPARMPLETLIGELGMNQHVRLFGQVEDPLEFYEAIDLFALSSVREGLPNALLEAMSMTLPVVATAIGGVPTVVRDEENGLLYAAGNVDSLTLALQRLLDDASLRERLAASARQTIEQRFTFHARMAAELAVYDRLRARPSG